VRIAGWVLLVGGFLLCVSVAWAALGFLLMGVGLIAMQAAERNRNRAKRSLASRDESPAAAPEIPDAPAETTPASARIAPRRPSRTETPYDKVAWAQLIESDPDLLRVTSVLLEYGQPYVDELARAYLAAGDKSRLPAIVDGIVRMAQRNIARANAAPYPIESPALDRPSRASSSPANQAGHRADAQFQRIPARAPVMPPPMPAEAGGGAAEMRPVIVPPVEASMVESAPVTGQRNTTITSADEDLTELIGMFARDSNYLRKN
jgi:hypothetical protein